MVPNESLETPGTLWLGILYRYWASPRNLSWKWGVLHLLLPGPTSSFQEQFRAHHVHGRVASPHPLHQPRVGPGGQKCQHKASEFQIRMYSGAFKHSVLEFKKKKKTTAEALNTGTSSAPVWTGCHPSPNTALLLGSPFTVILGFHCSPPRAGAPVSCTPQISVAAKLL